MYLSKRKARKRNMLILRLMALLLPMALAAAVFCPAAFATYEITDGDRVFTHTSLHRNPEAILDEAGLALGEQDRYLTSSSGGKTSITICRAKNVTVVYHGGEHRILSGEETVGALLQRLNMEPGEEDRLSHSPQAQTEDGMLLRVDRVYTRTQTYTTSLPFKTVLRDDPELPAGTRSLLTPGVPGQQLCTANITFTNGIPTKKEILSSTPISPAVDQVILCGTASVSPTELPLIHDGYITLPTGEVLTYTGTDTIRATAYTHTDEGCNLTTATGTIVHVGTVAVDPRYIPYGTRMFIMAADGSYVYGIAQAEDCGGDIKGDRMDLYLPTFAQCMEFGRRVCTIYYLG